MKKNFLVIIFFCICSILISCKQKSADDELAERMAKSENFKAIVNYGKKIGV